MSVVRPVVEAKDGHAGYGQPRTQAWKDQPREPDRPREHRDRPLVWLDDDEPVLGRMRRLGDDRSGGELLHLTHRREASSSA